MECKLCGSTLLTIRPCKDAKTQEKMPIADCQRCSLVQQAEMPSTEALQIYYSHHYRTDYKSAYEPKPKYVYRAGRTALDRLQCLQNAIDLPTGSRLLDVGAGGGEFVCMANKFGFHAIGIEPNQGYSTFARNAYDCEIRTGSLEDVRDERFDLISLFHVLEHMAEPTEVMRKLHSLLNPQGYLFLEVPNIWQKDASPHNIYFKAHLYYYSRASLTALTSPYFETVWMEDEGNLMAILRKRDTPLAAHQYPTAADLSHHAQRMARKGWSEYLFEGGGWKKPWQRLQRSQQEQAMAHLSAAQILERLAAPHLR